MYFLGIDVGSSSVKVALTHSESGKPIAVVQEPEQEMGMFSPQPGWAEQNPADWWMHCCKGIQRIISENQIDTTQITGIGIAYQMHGLVLVDKNGQVLRNSIIWCDSRAVPYGDTAFEALGTEYCHEHLLNSPSNFTAAKLAWVKANEPEIFAQIDKILLPGDFIAYQLSGQLSTTVSGLSEGIFWDFKNDVPAAKLLEHFGFNTSLLPSIVPTFGIQGTVSESAATQTGLAKGTPIKYRAGDQPNNALSLNVLQPGEVATTAGTSGVVYAVTAKNRTKESVRLNNFAHVNYTPHQQKNIGKLLCINGVGIQYRWLRDNLKVTSYQEMNNLAASVPVGADGLQMLPFGNGAERMFYNTTLGSEMVHLDFNRHHKAHVCRAALEGIAFAFMYGFEIMQNDGVHPSVLKTGNDNLFRSAIFSTTLAELLQKPIEIYNTTGAIGAARACILHDGNFNGFSEFLQHDLEQTITPSNNATDYIKAYNNWKKTLESRLNN